MTKILLYIWYKYIGFLFRLFPIKKNRIVFENFFGKGYGDNPKYIAEELLRQKNMNYELIWLIKGDYYSNIPDSIKQVKRGTIAELYYLSTAKIWIDNSRKPLGTIKRKKQYYIQTWHAPLGLKKIELDAYDNLSKYYKKVMKSDSKNIDLMISGCDVSYDIYKNKFLYNGTVEKYGTPRCDIFFDKEYCKRKKKEICDIYNIDKNAEIVLYAPTFRSNTDFSNIMLNLNYVLKNVNDNIVFIYRFHPNSNFTYNTNNNRIIDATNYPDMQDLICCADFLITDYSSCCFDMLIAGKPSILYVPDYNEYVNKERGFCFEFKDLPFDIAKNEKELINIFNSYNKSKYKKNEKKFMKKINLYEDGKSTLRIAKKINDLIS